MKLILAFVMILSLVVFVVNTGSQGAFSSSTAAWALVAIVIFAALGYSRKPLRESFIGLALKIALPVAGVATFVIWQGHGDAQASTQILGGILLVAIVLLGIYVIVARPFRLRRRRRRDD